jgi:hypothetical protein
MILSNLTFKRTKKSRDDFPLATKAVLAGRVGHRCSNSECDKPTSGPQVSPNLVINVGVAAHITAASRRGPRYDEAMSPEERSAPENGIWLCQTCAKLIDNDPDRFTVELLKQWKQSAEAKASLALQNHLALNSERASAGVESRQRIRLQINRFLAAQKRYCSQLPYVSIASIASSKSSDEVYIPARFCRPASSAVSDDGESAEDLTITEVLQSINEHPVLITGLPGAGKSTLLRYIAARVWQDPDDLGLASRLLPLLVPAARLAAARGSLDARLRDIVPDEYGLEEDLPEGFVQDWSRETNAKWILLIDGLDDVRVADQSKLLQWFQSLHESDSCCRILVSRRTPGLGESRVDSAGQWENFEVCALDPLEMQALASNWISSDFEEFQRQIAGIRDFKLATTPLFTTIAALVFRNEGALPARQTELYDRIVDILLQEAREHDLEKQLPDELCHSEKALIAFTAATMIGKNSKEKDARRLDS